MSQQDETSQQTQDLTKTKEDSDLIPEVKLFLKKCKEANITIIDSKPKEPSKPTTENDSTPNEPTKPTTADNSIPNEPSKLVAADYSIDKAELREIKTVDMLVDFLANNPSKDPKYFVAVGEFLGDGAWAPPTQKKSKDTAEVKDVEASNKENTQNSPNVLDLFTKKIVEKNSTNGEFLPSMREYLSTFKLPGEGQKVERILESFSKYSFASLPSEKQELFIGGGFPPEDNLFRLSISTIMLNTELEKPAIKAKNKMTKEGYWNLNSYANFPKPFLESIYDDIKKTPFQVPGRESPTNTKSKTQESPIKAKEFEFPKDPSLMTNIKNKFASSTKKISEKTTAISDALLKTVKDIGGSMSKFVGKVKASAKTNSPAKPKQKQHTKKGGYTLLE